MLCEYFGACSCLFGFLSMDIIKLLLLTCVFSFGIPHGFNLPKYVGPCFCVCCGSCCLSFQVFSLST